MFENKNDDTHELTFFKGVQTKEEFDTDVETVAQIEKMIEEHKDLKEPLPICNIL